jgi:hypothetical protein
MVNRLARVPSPVQVTRQRAVRRRIFRRQLDRSAKVIRGRIHLVQTFPDRSTQKQRGHVATAAPIRKRNRGVMNNGPERRQVHEL